MTVCCICDVEAGSRPECISFHRFPKQDDKRLLWLTIINENIKNFTLTANSQMCSQHFAMDCFVVTCSGRRYLKSNAVPSMFNMPLKQGLESIQKIPQQQSTANCSNIVNTDGKEILVQAIRIPIKIINASSNGNKTDRHELNATPKPCLTIFKCVTKSDTQVPTHSGISNGSSATGKEEITDLQHAKEYAATLKKKIKVSQQKCRRLQSRITFLKLLVKHLQNKKCTHQKAIKQ